MPGATSYKIPSSSGFVEGSKVKSESPLYSEEKEAGFWKGGTVLGWSVVPKGELLIVFYDWYKEEAHGTPISQVSSTAKYVDKNIQFTSPPKFNYAVYCKITGEVESGTIWLDIE